MLLTLFLGITGCASRQVAFPDAFECDKPPLRGETWADVAIMSVEQSAAIDICNIRNGVDTYRSSEAHAPRVKVSLRVPAPWECRTLGVEVEDGAKVTGHIKSIQIVAPGKVPLACSAEVPNAIGCAIMVGNHGYRLYYENILWVQTHESCHAYYEAQFHTREYIDTRE